ncbi:Rho termination factor N-terminal domain-containing protein [Kamptonema sp. UHCC 0994]|uniref:Rho termination factor N-terminal domain-containing protein n=1 Tax=Kamptonema sp. UHCC 0994 TaxID=3031329 RepID=UPI0023B9DC01|nr:Rho termination factor N-terminal domain-containing protein [Kamptonema sp. UHCC 0994]MDF0554918.1 Rho termination factor N-terminal domain-containing protein [Kamptonema sp. UHCC 0994]
MNTTIKALRETAQILAGVSHAIAILTIYPESIRRREITAAKRSIAERKAQISSRTAEIETELQEMKRELETEITPAPTAIAAPAPEIQPYLPAAPESAAKPAPIAAPAIKEPTIRELKAIASQRKIKNYSNMTKIQLMEALAI